MKPVTLDALAALLVAEVPIDTTPAERASAGAASALGWR
jgi:hypothetical protein